MWKYVDQRLTTVFSSNCQETCNKNIKKTFKQKTTSSLGESKLSDLDDRVAALIKVIRALHYACLHIGNFSSKRF